MSLKISDIYKNSNLKIRDFSRILSIVLDANFETIFLKFNDEISLLQKEKFDEISMKFKNNMPFEYLSNSCEFYGRVFFVDENVLIPRPETEFLIEKALKIAKNYQKIKILDLCTGSGIIAITMFLELQKLGIKSEIFASDISQNALKIAQKNAKILNAKIFFLHSDLFENINGNFDLILSNPPYISNSYKLDENVLKEPKIALFGGENGDEILKKIIEISPNFTKNLICEIGFDQKKFLEIYLQNYGFKAEFYKDFANFDRGFVAKII